MQLTAEQREHLETECNLHPCDTGRAILALLADLDAATAALQPVASAVREWRSMHACEMPVDLVHLQRAEADAVLAAVGGKP